MVNPQSRILVIAGTSLISPKNHRMKHLTAHLKQWGYPLDILGRMNFSSGLEAGTRSQVSRGLWSLFHKRARVVKTGDDLQITVRSLPHNILVPLQEIWDYFTFLPLLRKRYEVCIFGSPTNAFLALMLKKKGNVKNLIYDDWDYFPGDITAVRGPLAKIAMQWREKVCIKNAEMVISVSHPLGELRKKQGAREVTVVPNGVDYPLFQAAQEKRSHPPTLIYMGSLYDSWGVDLPIQALPYIRTRIPDIRYIVLGDGPDETTLRSLAFDQMDLQDHVFFLGRQEPQRLPYFLAEADIGVLTCRKEPFREYASPLKACEYMAAGLPVVATRVGEIAEIVEQSKTGSIIDFTPEAFAEAVIELLTDPMKYRLHSANAIRCAMTYDWEQVLIPLQNILDRLVIPNNQAENTERAKPA